MPFCPNCGTQITEREKFCFNCGYQITHQQYNSGRDVNNSQREAQLNRIGISKQLDQDETIAYQSEIPSPVISINEIKNILGQTQKEVPISIFISFNYLTNKRIIFLKLFESNFEISDKTNIFSKNIGTFYEIPFTAVVSVVVKPIQLSETDIKHLVNSFNVDENQLKKPLLELTFIKRMTSENKNEDKNASTNKEFNGKPSQNIENPSEKILILSEQTESMLSIIKKALEKRTLAFRQSTQDYYSNWD